MSDAIARIDAARARTVGRMLVNDNPEDNFDPETACMDLKSQTAEEMLNEYAEHQKKFQTAPFDTTGAHLRFYPGGITIWSGFPGSGKTTILREFCCHMLSRNQGVFFASLEEHPRNLALGIASVAGGVGIKEIPTAPIVQKFMDKYADKLRIWGVLGIAKHKRILAVIRKLGAQGYSQAIIDSLMCLDVANDDINEQREFATYLAATARASGVHIHLVAHPKKPQQNGQEPDINDVGGAKEIGGIADNVIFVRRGNPEGAGYGVPMKILVRKQRYWTGEWPTYEGYFQHEYRRFAPTPNASPVDYLYGA